MSHAAAPLLGMGEPDYWPMSVTASVLVCVGYVPEFRRLCVERRSSDVGIWMWLIWIASSSLSAAYAWLTRAPRLVFVNVAAICALTIAAALGNALVHRRQPGAASAPLPRPA